jgi:hypothetical protein
MEMVRKDGRFCGIKDLFFEQPLKETANLAPALRSPAQPGVFLFFFNSRFFSL